MADYEKKEEKVLEQIGDTLENLANTLDALDDTDSKVKSYFEQKKAIHEIKKVLRKVDKFNDTIEDEAEDYALSLEDLIEYEDQNLTDIGNLVVKLDKDLDAIDEDKDSKVKSYMLQKKVLHEVRLILKKLGKLDANEDIDITIDEA